MAPQGEAQPFGRDRIPQGHSAGVWRNIRHTCQLPGGALLSNWLERPDIMQLTLNSFMIGKTSSERASLVTSPPLRSILFPTNITGTYNNAEFTNSCKPTAHAELEDRNVYAVERT